MGWVVYAGYLHARAARGWTGTRPAGCRPRPGPRIELALIAARFWLRGSVCEACDNIALKS